MSIIRTVLCALVEVHVMVDISVWPLLCCTHGSLSFTLCRLRYTPAIQIHLEL